MLRQTDKFTKGTTSGIATETIDKAFFATYRTNQPFTSHSAQARDAYLARGSAVTSGLNHPLESRVSESQWGLKGLHDHLSSEQ